MTMLCYQCEETYKGAGCTVKGQCGKSLSTAAIQDRLVEGAIQLALAYESSADNELVDDLIRACLFSTVTNVSFDNGALNGLYQKVLLNIHEARPEHSLASLSAAVDKSAGVLKVEDPDLRSARELLIYGVKGIAAYADHAIRLGYRDAAIDAFIRQVMAAVGKPMDLEQAVGWLLQAGELSVNTMTLLDTAHNETFGAPEISEVQLGTGTRPGILVSGHDLHDLEQLLEQSKDSGVDIYTHGEMLPAHYYPKFKAYSHLKGNYGGAWWEQGSEFASFNGPILMTTNCLTTPEESYEERIFTTGYVGFYDIPHIDADDAGVKDFSALIALAKTCMAPTPLESGTLVGGFGHVQVTALADKVVDAVSSGAIKRFVVMAGCDGRADERKYYTEVAEQLPDDAVILTAGCAKYRYNKLDLGDIGGIPRVLDAGQCNDCYSLAVIAMKLQQAVGAESLNDLPLSFDVAWYEQKAVAVLLALLHLGIKGIRLGPTLPAFVTGKVADLLINEFGIQGIGSAEEDVAAMMAGR